MHYFHFKKGYFAAKMHVLHFKKSLLQKLPKVKYVKVGPYVKRPRKRFSSRGACAYGGEVLPLRPKNLSQHDKQHD